MFMISGCIFQRGWEANVSDLISQAADGWTVLSDLYPHDRNNVLFSNWHLNKKTIYLIFFYKQLKKLIKKYKIRKIFLSFFLWLSIIIDTEIEKSYGAVSDPELVFFRSKLIRIFVFHWINDKILRIHIYIFLKKCYNLLKRISTVAFVIAAGQYPELYTRRDIVWAKRTRMISMAWRNGLIM